MFLDLSFPVTVNHDSITVGLIFHIFCMSSNLSASVGVMNHVTDRDLARSQSFFNNKM